MQHLDVLLKLNENQVLVVTFSARGSLAAGAHGRDLGVNATLRSCKTNRHRPWCRAVSSSERRPYVCNRRKEPYSSVSERSYNRRARPDLQPKTL